MFRATIGRFDNGWMLTLDCPDFLDAVEQAVAEVESTAILRIEAYWILVTWHYLNFRRNVFMHPEYTSFAGQGYIRIEEL